MNESPVLYLVVVVVCAIGAAMYIAGRGVDARRASMGASENARVAPSRRIRSVWWMVLAVEVVLGGSLFWAAFFAPQWLALIVIAMASVAAAGLAVERSQR